MIERAQIVGITALRKCGKPTGDLDVIASIEYGYRFVACRLRYRIIKLFIRGIAGSDGQRCANTSRAFRRRTCRVCGLTRAHENHGRNLPQ